MGIASNGVRTEKQDNYKRGFGRQRNNIIHRTSDAIGKVANQNETTARGDSNVRNDQLLDRIARQKTQGLLKQFASVRKLFFVCMG